jgi:hypothetical protein
MKRKRVDSTARFWKKVVIRGKDDCWNWRGRGKNYPTHWDGKKGMGANRYSLQLKLGRSLKTEEFACHTCDNKRCVNPSHLFVGSSLDNSKDMVGKGRKESGEDVYGAKLTASDVLKLRIKYAKGNISIRDLAAETKVSEANLNHVLRGKTWKHVGGPIDTRKKGDRWRQAIEIKKAGL